MMHPRSIAGLAAAAFVLTASAATIADYDQAVKEARLRWETSPHGPMLERILPPTFEPSQLPEPGARGAQLVVRYCVQCHNLASPAMHNPEKWPGIVDRMVVRMKGRGNMGELMKEMMAGVQAPTEEEEKVLVAYLRKHGQRAIDPRRYPELEQPSGQSFKLACGQCHVLPDPRRHTAAEWPAVVARMEQNMAWMNRVVGTSRNPTEPQLRLDEILGFLQKYAREG
jgi:cytochrome c2